MRSRPLNLQQSSHQKTQTNKKRTARTRESRQKKKSQHARPFFCSSQSVADEKVYTLHTEVIHCYTSLLVHDPLATAFAGKQHCRGVKTNGRQTENRTTSNTRLNLSPPLRSNTKPTLFPQENEHYVNYRRTKKSSKTPFHFSSILFYIRKYVKQSITCDEVARVGPPPQTGDVILEPAVGAEQRERGDLVPPPRGAPDLDFLAHARGDETIVRAEADGADLRRVLIGVDQNSKRNRTQSYLVGVDADLGGTRDFPACKTCGQR